MLVLLGSARANGNTAKAVKYVVDEIPHKLINLSSEHIAPYNYKNFYPAKDSFLPIINCMTQNTSILFATPIYWYSMSGVMKIFFDRLTDLLQTHKSLGRSLTGRTCYVLSTGSDTKKPNGFDVPFRRTFKYFDMKFGGSEYVYAGGSKTQHQQSLRRARRNFQNYL